MDQMMTRELARQIAGVSEPPPRGDEFARVLERVGVFRVANGWWPGAIAESFEEAWLGRWLEAQRGEARRGTLPEDRLRLLEAALGPDWAAMAMA